MSKRKFLSLSTVVMGGLLATGTAVTTPALADEAIDEGGRNLVVFDEEGRMLVEGAVPSALFDDVIVRSVLITEEGDAVKKNLRCSNTGCNKNCKCPIGTE